MAKMWAAFFLSIMLVSTMNFYAIVREPDRIEVGEVHEHLSETVKVEGTLISWVRDPYSDGSDRVDLQVEDMPDVIKIRWYDTPDVPPIGATIIVEGEVVQYNGRIWINAKGMGAVSQKPGTEIEHMPTNLTGVSNDPNGHAGRSITLSGYISDALEPNVTWQSFYLMDNSAYIDSDHNLQIQLQGRVDAWHEAGSKVNLTGWMQFDERSYRWYLVVQSSMVEFIHEAGAKRLSWSVSAETWSYDVGKLVTVAGTASVDEDGSWWIIAPSGAAVGRICLAPDAQMIADDGFAGTTGDFTGRLFWSEGRAQICLDAGAAHEASESSTNAPPIPGANFTALSAITANPTAFTGQVVNVSGWTTGAISPDYDKGYLGDGPDYFSRTTTLRFQLAGAHAAWIEKGQQLDLYDATVMWDATSGRLVLEAASYGVGPVTAGPDAFAWGGSWDTWQWQLNTLVTVTGVLNESEDGTLWLAQSGTNARLCLQDDGTGADIQGTSTQPLLWTGRLVSGPSGDDGPGTQLCLML